MRKKSIAGTCSLFHFFIGTVYYPVFFFLAERPKTNFGVFLYQWVLVPLYRLDLAVWSLYLENNS